MDIIICLLDSELIYSVNATDTVSDLCSLVEADQELTLQLFDFIFEGKILNPSNTVVSSGITSGQVINVEKKALIPLEEHEKTPDHLITAVEEDCYDRASLLVESGVCVNAFGCLGIPPIAVCVSLQMLGYLLGKGATPDLELPSCTNPPLVKFTEKKDVKCVECLLAHGADPNISNTSYTSLHSTADRSSSQGEHLEIATALLTGTPAARIDVQTVDGSTPLLLACRNGNSDMVSLLLSHGADTGVLHAAGYSPLAEASFYGWVEIVDNLLSFGADPFLGVRSPYVEASSTRSSYDVLNSLILHQSSSTGNVHYTDQSLTTPLHEAVRSRDPKRIELLLIHGADPLQTDSSGESAYSISTSKFGNKALVSAIIRNTTKPIKVKIPVRCKFPSIFICS